MSLNFSIGPGSTRMAAAADGSHVHVAGSIIHAHNCTLSVHTSHEDNAKHTGTSPSGVPPAEGPEGEDEAGYRTPDGDDDEINSEGEEDEESESKRKDDSAGAPAWLARVIAQKRPVKTKKRGSRGSPVGKKTRERVPARGLTDDERWQLYVCALLIFQVITRVRHALHADFALLVARLAACALLVARRAAPGCATSRPSSLWHRALSWLCRVYRYVPVTPVHTVHNEGPPGSPFSHSPLSLSLSCVISVFVTR